MKAIFLAERSIFAYGMSCIYSERAPYSMNNEHILRLLSLIRKNKLNKLREILCSPGQDQQEGFCCQATSFLQCHNESIAAKFKTLLLFKEINRNCQRQQTGELGVFAETKNE